MEVSHRARWLGIFSVILLALTALIPNTFWLIGHNTVAAAHFITSALWGFMLVHVLERTSPSSDPVTEAQNRQGIQFKRWTAWTNLGASFMVVALFGLFKSFDAHDDHKKSDIMDASPSLQWLRWVLWPLFEYVVVACENLLTASLYWDFAGLDFTLAVNTTTTPMVKSPTSATSDAISSSSSVISHLNENKLE